MPTATSPAHTPNYERAATELLRAIRGQRSQVAFARRLGYTGNPITDWENQRRNPTAMESLRAAQMMRLPVKEAFTRFHPSHPPQFKQGQWQLAQWLVGLKGNTSILELARRTGRSRYTVSRWLSGESQPKLHEFLMFLDVLTGRVHDFVAALVPIEKVPSLAMQHAQAEAARGLAFKMPWTEVLLRVLETQSYQQASEGSANQLSKTLNLPMSEVEACLEGLVRAGIVRLKGQHYEVTGSLSVDTRNSSDGVRQLQSHWLSVAQDRVNQQQDWFAYNAISVSHTDLQRIQDKLRETFREIRSIVAASQPSENAALLIMDLIRFDDAL